MSTTSSRYSVENFEPQPDEELICSICRCVFEDPVECPCRHIFCRTCISSWLELKKSCPICRKQVFTFNLREVVPLIRNMIAKLTLVCPNHNGGCKIKVKLENYDVHVSGCQYEQINCKNKNCNKVFLRKNIKKHEKKECDFRMILCKLDCNLMLPSYQVKQHNCVKELKRQLEESSKREESLGKHIEELTNELNTLKKRNTESIPNFLRLDSTSTSFSSDSSNTTDLFESDSSAIQSLHSRLFGLSSFMSSVEFLSRLDGTSRRTRSSSNNDDTISSMDRSSPASPTPDDNSQDISNQSNDLFGDRDFFDVENNNSTQLHDSYFSRPRFRYIDLCNTDRVASETPSTSMSTNSSLEVDDEFPTPAQRRILKRKRSVSVISITSDSDDTDEVLVRRRLRTSNSNVTTRNNRRNVDNRHVNGTAIPRSIVPVEILLPVSPSGESLPLDMSTASPSGESLQTEVSRGNGLERTRALLESFSVETDPDWEPRTETSEGEMPNIRSVPAAELLDSIINGYSSAEDDYNISTSELEVDDIDYEVLIPERTYDLLNRYSREDSEDDEDWIPQSLRYNL